MGTDDEPELNLVHFRRRPTKEDASGLVCITMDSLVSSYNEPGLEYGEANSMLIFTEKFGKDRSSTVLELYAHSGGNDVGLYTLSGITRGHRSQAQILGVLQV